jgi:hypothetical protein
MSPTTSRLRVTKTSKTMTTQQIANRLVELCRKGEIQKAGAELYSDSIVSIEPEHSPSKTAKGKAAVAQKGEQFAASVEHRHGGSFSDPIVAGRYFSTVMTLDATFKGQGRMNLEEVCVYETKDGKIVSEQFFF